MFPLTSFISRLFLFFKGFDMWSSGNHSTREIIMLSAAMPREKLCQLWRLSGNMSWMKNHCGFLDWFSLYLCSTIAGVNPSRNVAIYGRFWTFKINSVISKPFIIMLGAQRIFQWSSFMCITHLYHSNNHRFHRNGMLIYDARSKLSVLFSFSS